MNHRLVALGAAVAAVVALVAGVAWWRASQTTELARAVALAPAVTERITWTHWAGVRRDLGADVSADSSPGELADFLTEAYDADLSPMSALLESAEVMQGRYGFSPATVEWEMLAQSPAGAAVVVKLPEDTDFEAVADDLESLGYQRPDDDAGVWRGGIDLLPRIGTLTPLLQHLALDEDEGVVVGSDTERYAETAIEAVTGEVDAVTGLDEVVEASGEPLAAAVYAGDEACSALAMGSADPGDQDQARELVAAAGEVHPLTGFAMAMQGDRDLRVAMSFEDDEQARVNADTRARLASGPAPGQGGDFPDRFRLGQVVARGELVTMELDPVEGSYVLSDLTSGPVLFATC